MTKNEFLDLVRLLTNAKPEELNIINDKLTYLLFDTHQQAVNMTCELLGKQL